jgi:hypothetical protein
MRCFFKFKDAQISDISIAQLDHADLIHGFQEIYQIIESYIGSTPAGFQPKFIRWTKATGKFIGKGLFDAAFGKFLEILF